ncbi:MAG TPA: carboxypeptidase regulatory-like domain-containing protein [bacterium]
MGRQRLLSMLAVIAVAIGCGSGTPQDAQATGPDERAGEPIVIAQATGGDSAPEGGASVTGSVRFEGTPPERERIRMSADPVCEQKHQSAVYKENVVVNDNGTLRNVFVYVKEGVQGSHPAPSEPVVLDQSGCGYTPHVFGVRVNQPLEIRNSDATLHNVNAKPSGNRPFNLAQPVLGMKTTKTFTEPEIMVPFKCNVHPWMSAYAGVVAHPFFGVTGEDGAFTISGLPAGDYVLEAWHEEYGTKTQPVSVPASGSASVEFAFSAN